MADGDVKITLSSQEGTRFEVPLRVANMSKLVETMTEDGDTEEEVPLMDVKASVLEKVIQFCTHHADPANAFPDIEKPLKTANLAEVVPQWDASFVEVEQEMLFELILAANYLDIKPLLDLTCAKVATMMKGKTPEEIRKVFNIKNDFTPEEEAQVREENRWCEEA
ncbi:sconC [Symbiodinium sp. KB8]|nr:sconC [Symbiodinium sp. KB8]